MARMPDINCTECGKQCRPVLRRRTCSDECSRLRRNAKARSATFAKCPRSLKVTCVECGDSFKPRTRLVKCCGEKCTSSNKRKCQTRIQNARYRADPEKGREIARMYRLRNPENGRAHARNQHKKLKAAYEALRDALGGELPPFPDLEPTGGKRAIRPIRST